MITRELICREARGWIGTPYLHQASIKGVGCDCLGLVRGVWREVVGEEPETPEPYRADWAEVGGEERLLEAARRWLVEVPADTMRAGDVLLFRMSPGAMVKHCAILSEPGRIIHAHDGAAVTEVALTPWWRRHLSHAFSFPGVTD